jgi:hypothetical protein
VGTLLGRIVQRMEPDERLRWEMERLNKIPVPPLSSVLMPTLDRQLLSERIFHQIDVGI